MSDELVGKLADPPVSGDKDEAAGVDFLTGSI
jgi:hypothetical protein